MIDGAGSDRFLGQGAVETGHAHEIRALLGHREDDGAAEAVADGGDATGVDARIRLDQVVGRHEALLADPGLAAHRRGPRPGLLGVLGRLALAVHVEREGDVALLGQRLGAFFRVVVQAPPFVHHDDRRPLALGGIVVGEKADQRRVAGLVLHRFGLDRRGSGRDRGKGQ